VGTAPAPAISSGFNRRSFVGLASSDYGTVTFGRDYTPGYYAQQATDALGFHLWGNAQSAIDLTGTGSELAGRISNAIFYESPRMKGLRIRAAYSLGAGSPGGPGAAPKEANRYIGIGGDFRADNLILTMGLSQVSIPTLAGTPVAFTGETSPRKDFLVGAKYDFGSFKLSGGYAQFDRPGPSNTGKQMWIGASGEVGTGTLYAQLQKVSIEAAVGTEPRANIFAVAYTYPFSRRTLAFASYGRTDNNSTGKFRLYSSGTAVAGAAGQDPQAFSLGIYHTF
jgi:predicted porin